MYSSGIGDGLWIRSRHERDGATLKILESVLQTSASKNAEAKLGPASPGYH